jgi:hypothetical protein
MEHKIEMNNVKLITLVNDFFPRPKWRYRKEGAGSGEEFREDFLVKELNVKDQKTIVDMTGYNRYGPSFISEAFGGLVREHQFTIKFLKIHLEIKHDDLPSLSKACWTEIEEATQE